MTSILRFFFIFISHRRRFWTRRCVVTLYLNVHKILHEGVRRCLITVFIVFYSISLHEVGTHANADTFAVATVYAGLGMWWELTVPQAGLASLETFESDSLGGSPEECSAGVAAVGCNSQISNRRSLSDCRMTPTQWSCHCSTCKGIILSVIFRTDQTSYLSFHQNWRKMKKWGIRNMFQTKIEIFIWYTLVVYLQNGNDQEPEQHRPHILVWDLPGLSC